jgi:hypothetical protein
MKDKLIIAAGLIFLIAVVATCNTCWVTPTVITKDTVYVHVKDSTNWYRPQITSIQGAAIPDPSKVRVDSFTTIEHVVVYVPMNVDTAAILADYFSKIYYSDTTKTKYGNVIIKDTVTQNRIAARQVITDFKIPEVTITKTISPKRKQWSIGPQFGYGANQKPYVGIGMTYSLIKF